MNKFTKASISNRNCAVVCLSDRQVNHIKELMKEKNMDINEAILHCIEQSIFEKQCRIFDDGTCYGDGISYNV